MEPLNTTDVETDAGTYQIHEYLDYDDSGGGNPLTEFDHPGFQFAIFQDGRYETLNTLEPDSHAGAVVHAWLDHGYDDDEIIRRFEIWQAISGDQTVLVTHEASADSSTFYRCLVLVEYDAQFSNWDRKVSAAATLREFESWVRGEVYGYEVTAPDGRDVDSVWGFIGDESRAYMIEEARSAIEYDAQQRLNHAALFGAGFVGII